MILQGCSEHFISEHLPSLNCSIKGAGPAACLADHSLELQGSSCPGAMGDIRSWREIAQSSSRLWIQGSKQVWAAVDNQMEKNQWQKTCSCGESDLYWQRWKLSSSLSFSKLLELLIFNLAWTSICNSLKYYKDIFSITNNRWNENFCLSKASRNRYGRKKVSFQTLKVMSEAQATCQTFWDVNSSTRRKSVFQEGIPSPALPCFSCC